jgi:hypothetical protein
MDHQAKKLYHENKTQYNERALQMVKEYAHPRPIWQVISLKQTTKQIIYKKLDYQSLKINQLPLPKSLKQYLNNLL